MTDKNKPYYGPAGIFSTDNPQTDAMQILAESYDEEEEYLRQQEGEDDRWIEEDFGPEFDTPMAVVFHCQSQWYEQKTIWESEEEKETKEAQARHDEKCPCGQIISCNSADF